MNGLSHPERFRAKLTRVWLDRAFRRKAISFGLIGIINTSVDYGVFLLARAALSRMPAVLATFSAVAERCQCGDASAVALIAANFISWMVAVSGSYVMNSSITFAAESGRRLRWSRYFAFVASGVLGWLANTAMLLVAVEIFLLPVWLAKGVAILAAFLVNFLLSHFVVFRAPPEKS